MRIVRKSISAFLAGIMLAGCTSSSVAATAQPSVVAKPEIAAIILFSNDIHGHIIGDTSEPSWGDARIAKEKQDLIAAGYDTYLFSAGDDSQGELSVNTD